MGLSTFSIFKNIDVENNPELKVVSDEELHKLQETLLGMLIEIDAFCRENNIAYTLAGGSALGAMRHGGFIPWDDDVDLLMSRRDYEKLKRCFEKQMGDRFWLHTPEYTPNYGLGFPRIRKKGTVCRSRDDKNNSECGVYVDIFLMENTFNLAPLRYFHGFLSMMFGFLLSCRLFYENRELNLSLVKGNQEAEKVFRKKINIGKMLSVISLDNWVHAWNNVNRMCKNDNSKFVTVPVGRKHFFKEMYEREWACHMERCDYNFDGKTVKLSLMKGVRKYLEKMYGDYMMLPNPEDIEKHVVLELKL